ncbi:MAG: hypothetical protein KME64_09250 [Scytonematopsis contorta HA4267-MV1]|nr:hypothetical protein [Scytonematopsis contorta HA4267-MV1]
MIKNLTLKERGLFLVNLIPIGKLIATAEIRISDYLQDFGNSISQMSNEEWYYFLPWNSQIKNTLFLVNREIMMGYGALVSIVQNIDSTCA